MRIARFSKEHYYFNVAAHVRLTPMETIQITIEESVLAEAEQVARSLEMTRSDFIKEAVERALRQRELIAMERKHAQAYARRPQTSDEVSEWESEQEWGEP